MKEISVTEFKARLDAGTAPKIIDVREPHEYEMDHIASINIPMGEIPTHLDNLCESRDEELVINCRSGGRSGQITHYLTSQGFSNVYNLAGGMLAWKANIDPNFNVQ
ncbi:MAG TPA: rhodanese-like domain-containing protein [Bacteroidetes bacterium]|nr:rhodanese-like domain-containing protein [Bacteroidota bacterium]